MSNSNSRPEQTAPLAAAPGHGLREQRSSPGPRGARAVRRGFTLIELLVVISIIGVLASLVLGLSGLATRKSKESRVRTELTKIGNDIENYKAALGFYPPDHQVQTNINGISYSVGMPSPNPLFFELSGTLYTNNQFTVLGRMELVPPAAIPGIFGTSGFGNAARDRRDLKFSTEFRGSQIKRIRAVPPIDVLAVPVKGRPFGAPGSWTLKGPKGEDVNPWLYVSTSPTNNADRFDLWTEVVIGGKLMRFSNWEKDTAVLSP